MDRFLEKQEDGMYYFYYKQHATVSGRYGSDAQQLPRPKEEGEEDPIVLKYNNLIRGFFISKPGNIFIDCDYSSLEPRVFAHVSGDDNLKKQYEEFLSNNPKFPAIGSYNPSDRLALEREIIKQLNNKFNFSDEFNKFVAVHYVKYFIDLKTLQPSIKVIKDEGFKVKLKSKNSPGHDTDKIGFEI
jgi:hypothetical protein